MDMTVTGPHPRVVAEATCVGGLRRAHQAVERVRGLATAGQACGAKLHRHLMDNVDDVDLVNRLVREVKDVEHTENCLPGRCTKCMLGEAVSRFRKELADIIGATDTDPVCRSDLVATDFRAGLSSRRGVSLPGA